jgi:proton translocating ATP synthase F1 alpha subunit
MTDRIRDFTYLLEHTTEVGFVQSSNYPLVTVTGLPNARLNDLVVFEDNTLGVITGISDKFLNIATYSKSPVSANTKVVCTNTAMQLPVSEAFLGMTLDAFNKPIHDTAHFSEPFTYIDLSVLPKEISQRRKITQPYYTGVAVVDILLPLGKGQRELVVGDTKTGKTSFLLQLCSFQSKIGSIVIYCCIGKSKSSIQQIEKYFNTYKLKDRTILYVCEATDPLISIINMPFIAMSTAEWFCNKGYDVTLILDDLSTHAKYYREFSLLSDKFPGRNSYPGDIFNLHAKLLERAGNFALNSDKQAEASITCFPVVDTIENDVSGYIQTNIMSITDGHLFFDKDIFLKGRRPPVNYFLSVTRVGRQTQTPLRWAISRELLSFLSLYEKVQRFVQFGAELNEGTQSTLIMGERIEASFNQDIEDTMPISLQIVIIALIWLGIWNKEPIASLKVNTKKMMNLYQNDSSYAGLVDSLVYNAHSMNELLLSINQNITNITKYV